MEDNGACAERSGEEAVTPHVLGFSLGNPQLSLLQGSLFLKSQFGDSTRVLVPQVPSYMTAADLCHFVSPFESQIVTMWLLRDTQDVNSYHALIELRDAESVLAFAKDYDGKVFSSLGTERCHVRAADKVLLEDSSYMPSCSEEAEACPICLETLGARQSFQDIITNLVGSKSGQGEPSDAVKQPSAQSSSTSRALIITLCSHAMHVQCLTQWGDNSCPVCRYCLEPAPASNTCQECEIEESLWMCLICGHVGCGRGVNKHALRHFEMTSHTFSMEVESGKVWDYAGDNFVHRLIAASTEGKMVELSPEHATSGRDSEVHREHLSQVEAVIEAYNRQVTTELDQQRRYYERRMLEAQKQGEQRIAVVRRDVDQQRQHLHESEERLARVTTNVKVTRERLQEADETLRSKKKQVEGLKQFHQKISTEQDKWRSELDGLKAAISSLDLKTEQQREHVRDLSLHLKVLEKVQAPSASGVSDVGAGPVSGAGRRTRGGAGEPDADLAGAAVIGVAAHAQRRSRKHGRR
mmetsp:Transcript_5105/g.15274  ORF Transcript_5105/g.15274 Transcript_5105/m.15274 type:complete len:524 (-) Transcript_5105:349-1920(-)